MGVRRTISLFTASPTSLLLLGLGIGKYWSTEKRVTQVKKLSP
jgi:hypothetical protein